MCKKLKTNRKKLACFFRILDLVLINCIFFAHKNILLVITSKNIIETISGFMYIGQGFI